MNTAREEAEAFVESMDFEPRAARGYEKLAIDLENHISGYQPGMWSEAIREYCQTPMISVEAAQELMGFYRQGTLEASLESVSKTTEFPFDQLSPWYVQEAVNNFFSENKFGEYEEELK